MYICLYHEGARVLANGIKAPQYALVIEEYLRIEHKDHLTPDGILFSEEIHLVTSWGSVLLSSFDTLLTLSKQGEKRIEVFDSEKDMEIPVYKSLNKEYIYGDLYLSDFIGAYSQLPYKPE